MHALLILNRRLESSNYVPAFGRDATQCRVRAVEILERKDSIKRARVRFSDGSVTWAPYARLCTKIEELESKTAALLEEEPPTVLAGSSREAEISE